VLAAHYFRNNAELIQACARLRFLKRSDWVLDPTYGRGLWWSLWEPRKMTFHDLVLDGVDFRNTGYESHQFDAIAFDPPYVSVGGRSTTGIQEMYDRYGLWGAPTSPALLQALINDGLAEMQRLVKRRGIVFVKCQDYVSSGKLWSGTYYTEQFARSIGYDVVEKFIHVKKSGGPQPKNRTRKDGTRSRQMHARHNSSMMLVLRSAA
jgi:tRNA G10  N-methylase Trm11